MLKLAFVCGLLFAPCATAQEPTWLVKGDCLTDLEKALLLHPMSRPIQQMALPMGAAYDWQDQDGEWVMIFLEVGYGVHKQGWGKDFGKIDQCHSGDKIYNVWFAKYYSDGT